jgi:hypothetical protein
MMRKIIRFAVAAFMLLVVLIALLPYLMELPALRNLAVRAALPKINGTASVGDASLGWTSPLALENIEIRDPDGRAVVSVPRVAGDRAWWRYLAAPSDLGQFSLNVPAVNIVVGENGVNLWQVFATDNLRSVGAVEDLSSKAAHVALPSVAMSLQIQKATLAFQGRGAAEPWRVENINLKAALARVPGGGAALVIEPGDLFDHVAISQPMCNDLLQFVAPLLANVAQVSGRFSLKLDRWQLPADDPRRGSGQGQLIVHAIDVAPGPLVQHLASILHLPPTTRLVENSTVLFRLENGRIYHQDLQFRLRDITIRTHGSVGFDESLELVAEVPLGGSLANDPALGSAGAGHVLSLPIRGTLRHPQLDIAALHKANVAYLKGAIDSLIKNRLGGTAGQDISTLLQPVDGQTRDERHQQRLEKAKSLFNDVLNALPAKKQPPPTDDRQ